MQPSQQYSRVTRSLERLNISNIKNVPIKIIQKGRNENHPIIAQLDDPKDYSVPIVNKIPNPKQSTEFRASIHSRANSNLNQDPLELKNSFLFRSYGEENKTKIAANDKYQTAPNTTPENLIRMSYDLSSLKSSEPTNDRLTNRRHSEKKYSIDLGFSGIKQQSEYSNQDSYKSKPPLKERISINTDVANKAAADNAVPFVTPKFAMSEQKSVPTKKTEGVSKSKKDITEELEELQAQKENIQRLSNMQSSRESNLTERRSFSLASNRNIPSLEAINEKLTKNRKLLTDIQNIENQIRNEIQSLDNEISSYVDQSITNRKILQERRTLSIDKEVKPVKSGLYSEVFEDIENKVQELNQKLNHTNSNKSNINSQFLRSSFKNL